jgi:hypothetical protein
MDVKKLPFPEQLLSRKRKVVSGFGLGVGVSLVVLVALFLNRSLKIPTVFQGLDSVGDNSSFVETPLPFSSIADSASSSSNSSFADTTNATSEFQNYVDLERGSEEGKASYKTHEANVSGITEREDLKAANGKGKGSEETQLGNFSESVDNGGFATDEANGSVVGKTGDSLVSDGGVSLEKNNSENLSETLKNGSVLGQERNVLSGKDVDSEEGKSIRNSSIWNNGRENNSVGNFSYNGGLDKASSREEKASEANHQGNLDEQNKITNSSYGFHEACDIFDGRWVRDDSKPYYPPGSCPYIDKDFDCHYNRRTDDGYLKWKWQPNRCDIPR